MTKQMQTDAGSFGLPALMGMLIFISSCGDGREVDMPISGGDGVYNEVAPVVAEAQPGQPGPTPGTWVPDQAARALVFTGAGGAPLVRLACDDRGGMIIERLGQESIGDIEMMELHVDGEIARLALNEVETEPPVLRAAVPFNDDLLVRLAFPQGLLSIKAGDTPRLQLPLDEETARQVAACERPDNGRSGR